LSAADPPPSLRLIILAGQSNMSGRGKLSELPREFPRNGNRLWTFTNAWRWEPAREPVDSAEAQVDQVSSDEAGVGPGLAFADALADRMPRAAIGLIPCARGATSIRQWQPATGRDTLYGSCLARIREASRFGRPFALLWYQGESDVESMEDVRAWAAGFARFLSALRSDLGEPALPAVSMTISGISQERSRDSRFRLWDELRAVQLGLRMDRVIIIDTAGFDLSSDGLHLSTSGQLSLGRVAERALCSQPEMCTAP
jgi:hypothetical protein